MRVMDLAPGRWEWNVELRTGRVAGTAPLPTAGRPTMLAIVCELPDDVVYVAPLLLDAEGAFTVDAVPAGPARIAAIDGRKQQLEPAVWPTRAEFEVLAGGETSIDVPE